jgi:hypothetical protein
MPGPIRYCFVHDGVPERWIPSRPVALLLFGCALLGVVLVLVATAKYGIGHHSDSSRYVSAARSVVANQGLVEYTGEPYVAGGPMYPMLLALGLAFGAEPLAFARWLHALGFGLVIVLAGVWLKRVTAQPVLWAVGVLLVMTSGELFDQATTALTDLTFIVLTIASLMLLETSIATRKRRIVLLAATLAAGAWLTRYIGVALVMTGGLLLALFPHARRPLARFMDATAFVLLGSLPMAWWLVRNHLASGTTTGVRARPLHTFTDFLRATLEAVGSSFVPPHVGPAMRVVGGGVLVLCALAVLVWAWRGATLPQRPRLFIAGADVAASVAAAFVLVYLAVLVALGTVSQFSYSAVRYVAPAVVPSIVVIVTVGSAAMEWLRLRRSRVLTVGVLAALGVLLVWPVWRLQGWVRYARAHGAGGYASDQWQHSELVRAARALGPTARVYTNEPNLLYFLAGLTAPQWTPGHDHPTAPLDPRTALRRFADSVDVREPAYVVMFAQSPVDTRTTMTATSSASFSTWST